ncbi:MAG: class I SAM-dependent methyltransferase [Alphaproteobacteria bacterium]|nr:class I SAM-dependent methyltransferase [Alphaproteobacteria bacterium]
MASSPEDNTIQETSYSSTYAEMLEKAKIEEIDLPSPEEDGRIQTLNLKGAMAPTFDLMTQAFLNNIQGKRALEIGAAYGNVLLESLKRECAHYTANDLDTRHLMIAALRISQDDTLQHLSLNEILDFYPGSYPDQVKVKSSAYDAILCTRVLHFFPPLLFNRAIEDFYRALKPGGKVYILAITPYVKFYESFIPEYEKRKEAGVEHPGYVNSLLPYVNRELVQELKVRNLINEEEPFMFLDTTYLSEKFSKIGFIIEKCSELALNFKSRMWQYDGREHVGLIAQKPLNNE